MTTRNEWRVFLFFDQRTEKTHETTGEPSHAGILRIRKKPLIKFRVSTILLLILLLAVSLGWVAERYRNAVGEHYYYATITTPREREIMYPDDTLSIEGVFYNRNPESLLKEPPIVLVQLQGPRLDFVIEHSGVAQVTQGQVNPNEYYLRYDLERKDDPIKPGIYLLRLKCLVDGEEVVAPSRIIIVQEDPNAPLIRGT